MVTATAAQSSHCHCAGSRGCATTPTRATSTANMLVALRYRTGGLRKCAIDASLRDEDGSDVAAGALVWPAETSIPKIMMKIARHGYNFDKAADAAALRGDRR